MSYIENIVKKCTEYIVLCDSKAEYHQINAKNAQLWNNFLNTSNVVMSGLMTLSMSILTALDAFSMTVTIIGATFSFFILIGNKLKDDYSFKSLSFMHYSASDEYSALKQQFILLLNDIEKHKFNSQDFDLLVNKYEAIKQKSHYQTIKKCNFFCCFRN